MNKEFSPLSQIAARVLPTFFLDRIIKNRQAEAPVFFPKPSEALTLLALPAADFALRFEKNEYEGFNMVGAAYDCLRLKDKKKAGDFLEILKMAAGEKPEKATLAVALAVGFRIKKDEAPFEDQKGFLAFCKGYGIEGLTEEYINDVIKVKFKD